MQPLNLAKKLLPRILFLLLAVMAPLPPCVAVTIEEIYDDNAAEGFKDGTYLTEAEKNLISPSGNDAETLGEARTKAFEHATSLLESTLTNTNTIRISARFVFFSNQKDPSNPGKCLPISGRTAVARAGPTGYGYPESRLDEGDADRIGLGTAYPYALYETTSGSELNAQNADIRIRFSKCVPFYYGFTEPAPTNHVDFVQLALHEIMHGIGFFEDVRSDGDFSTRIITVYSTVNGVTTTRKATIKSRTIYDEQLYANNDLFINLTNSQRAAAIASGTGLLWDGTDGGRNGCSYGQRMAELKTSSAKVQDGKPLLHAPSTYISGESVIHTHANAEDIMEAFVPAPRNMDLTLGMLKDMGWSVSADGFPPDCEPTGITVTDTSELVTTEGGGKAKFEVRLESEPLEDVVIPLTSSDTSEGTPDMPELTFTPRNWDIPQEVTVTGADDDFQDGPQDYFITLEKAESDDKFYDGFLPEPQTVFLRNEDDDDLPDLFIEDSSAREEENALNFTVTLNPQTARTVTIRYTITDGTAREGSDYTATPASGTLTFAPGQTKKAIAVRLIDDNLDESDEESLTVTLSNPQNAVLAQNGDTATGIIRDNDEATLHIENTSAGEGAGSMNFTVRLSPQSVLPVTVQYSITGNTARGGSDYETVSSSGTLTFAPEESRNTINVSLIDDDEQEANETFSVTLFNPQNAVLAQNGDTATGTIRDNDQAQPPPPPPAAEGGGGCVLAEGAHHQTKSAAANPLLIVTVLLSVFLRKTRSTNQPRYGRSC